jgi:hypothetical protein
MNELEQIQTSTGEVDSSQVFTPNITNNNSTNGNNDESVNTNKKRRKKKKGKTKINRYISQNNKINLNEAGINDNLNQHSNNNESTNNNTINIENGKTNNNQNQHDNIVINNTINTQLNNNHRLTTPIETPTEPISKNRQLKNEEKGDSLDFKPDNHLRFIFQNINSLRPNSIDKWAATTRQIFQFFADVVGFCETCTNWRKRDLKKRFQISANKSLKNPILSTTTTTLNYDADYVPGGCCQITANSWTTRHDSVIYDSFRHGRWVGNTYRLSTDRQLHIVTAYRVCEQQPNETNSLSTSTQQHIMLAARGIQNPNPRKQCVDDFIAQFQEMCDNNNNYFILAIDANATLGKDREGLDRLASECNLIDMYSTIHQDYSIFPTQQRGSQRIIYILCSRYVIPFITQCGYVRFNEGFDSDHRAVFCDISHEILTDTTMLREKRKRIIGSNSTNKEGERYIRCLYRMLNKKDIFQSVESILQKLTETNYDSDTIMIQVNALDTIITELMLQAEDQSVCVKDMTLWSPALAQSNLIIQYWIVTIKGSRQKTNVKKRVCNIIEKMNENTKNIIRTSTSSATRLLRKAINNHNELVKQHKLLRIQYLQLLENPECLRSKVKG